MDCNTKCDSSINTSILNDESEPKIQKEKRTRRRRPHKHARSSHYSKNNSCTSRHTNVSCTDKHVSQIHVEKQDFQCIINLNTTVCQHKSKHRQKCDEKHRSKCMDRHYKEKNKSKESKTNFEVCKTSKIVPKCFRQKCQQHSNESRKSREIYGKKKVENHHMDKQHSRQKEAKYEVQSKTRCIQDKHQHSDIEKKHMGSRLLSPISSSPFTDDLTFNLTYEDISNTSLQTQEYTPVCHKVIKICKHGKYREKHDVSAKHVKHNKRMKQKWKLQESKLDTLIRRTKERERKLVAQSRSEKSWFTSTPIRNEYSSGDFPMTCTDMNVSCSDMDISFNSQSTLVLETGNLAYSPSCPIEELLSERAYTPSSPTRSEDYAMKVPENNNFELLKIKNEPNIDSGAYSPIRIPDNTETHGIGDVTVKKEFKFKTEPIFSPKLSPIYFENEAFQYSCKTESIKSEIIIVD